MERTLAEIARDGASLEARLRVALGLARAVRALHGRGAVHGALSPGAVLVAGDDAVVVAPALAPSPLALAGFAAPEVVRGAPASRRSDAFATGALVQLALTGRGPWDDGEPLEVSRRVLFEPPRPARLDEPGIPPGVDEVIARMLQASARRRARPEELVRAIKEALGIAGREASASRTPSTTAPSPRPSPPADAGGEGEWAATAARPLAVDAGREGGWRATAGRLAHLPLRRVGLAVALVALAGYALVPRSGAELSREVAMALARGDVAGARARLDRPPRGVERALLEKLRGDVACARRAPAECLRRYRTALAARPALREDEALRRNVRALLAPGEACATRRSAALLAGELRDPDALPALEAARRSGGLFAFLCTGDAIDRAIAATRGAR